MKYELSPGDHIVNAATDHIEILSVIDEFVTAKVHSVSSTFDSQNLKHGFVPGEILTFKLANDLIWIILEPEKRPWHVLGIDYSGRKYFEHYR